MKILDHLSDASLDFPGLLAAEAPERLEQLKEAKERLHLWLDHIPHRVASKAAADLVIAADLLLFGSEGDSRDDDELDDEWQTRHDNPA